MKWYLEVNETDYETVELGDIAMSRWQTSPGMEQRKKKVIIPKKSRVGLNITHDASRCFAFIHSDPSWAYRQKVTQRQQSRQHPGSKRWFSFERSMVFRSALANKCYCRVFGYWCVKCCEGALEEHNPSRLLLAWFTAKPMSHGGHAVQTATSMLSALLIFKVERCPAVSRGHGCRILWLTC